MNKYDNNFYDGEDLIECLNRGCEVEFEYDGKKYSITHDNGNVVICEFYNENSEKVYSNVSDVLNYSIGGKKLNDIISEMKVVDRSF